MYMYRYVYIYISIVYMQPEDAYPMPLHCPMFIAQATGVQ